MILKKIYWPNKISNKDCEKLQEKKKYKLTLEKKENKTEIDIP